MGILGTVDGRWEWADSEIIAGGYMMEKLCQDLNTQQKDLFQEEPHIPETLNSRIKEILTEHFPEQASIEVTLSDKFVLEDVVPEFSPLCAIILETTEQLGILGTDSGTWAWVDSGSIAGGYLMSKLCQELNGRGLTKEEALYNMRVGDTIPFSHETNAIRVPGGWIFISEGSSCFVKG